jgi:glutamine synthetase
MVSVSFIEHHGLWGEAQRRQAEEIKLRLERDTLRFVRLVWSDSHGYARAKLLTVPAFLGALKNGYNINVATTTLDSAGARTFAPERALAAADTVLLFRTATRQVCRRMGYFATFMCRPKIAGYYSSGWHLHQSVTDAKTGANLFMPEGGGAHLSPLGSAWLAGLLHHAVPATVFATPTINGYRRFRPNSLAPDRATWAYDHRGVMVRVLGGMGDAATRLENRVGEPAANPYLYIAAQIAAGLAGVEGKLPLPPPDDAPYAAERTMLPTSLTQALDALDAAPLFRRDFGEVFIDYYLALKRTEAGRYLRSLEDSDAKPQGDEASEWEQNEYFDFF